MTDAIGGYFGTEPIGEGVFPHQQGVLLNTGRNALEYILRYLPVVKRVYLPYYTCEVVWEPLKKLHIPYRCYATNEHFEMAEEIVPEADEYVIVNNYFGIKDAYIAHMAEKYGNRLIVDCAQAFFAPILTNTHTFYSIRKYVGVADGGVAYPRVDDQWKRMETDDNSDRAEHLKIRLTHGAEAGFRVYQENENKLDHQPIKQMAVSTQQALQQVDYRLVIEKRRTNYGILHEALKDSNRLELPEIDSFVCPMVYPYWPQTDNGIRQRLQENRIYTARYWPNVTGADCSYHLEADMAQKIIPLPIDQRYGQEEMKKIIELIKD